MNRRKFLKASLCAGCVAALGGGCFFSNSKNNDLVSGPEKKFLYKSVDELPTSVRLEACNACQLNCPECGIRKAEQAIIEKGGGFGYLKFEDFKKFIDKHSFIKSIELSNNGEIFLNPELDDIIKYSYEKEIILSAYNGVNMNTVSEKTLENLVKYKFSGMSVSIDGATPDVYKIYRRGGDLDTVFNNIRIINKYKKLYDSDLPYLSWQFILFGHNEHEIDLAKERAKELDMDIRFIANESPDYSPIQKPKIVEEKTGIKFVYKTVNGDDGEGTMIGVVENDDGANYCLELSNYPQINFNGDLLGCCILAEDNFKVNVFKEGLLNALNSEHVLKAKLMLSDFTKGPYNELACSTCGVYSDLKKANHPVDFFEKA